MPPDEKANQTKTEGNKKDTEDTDTNTEGKNTPPPASFKTDSLLNFALSESKEKDDKEEKEEKEEKED